MRKHTFLLAACLLCCVILPLAACVETTPPLPAVEVAMGIFSGRPDPAWTLAPEQTEMLLAKLDALPNGAVCDDLGGLGYHGFYVRIEHAGARGGEWITVYDGAVRIATESREIWKADPQRALEAWLLELATAYVDPALVAEARASFAHSP